MQGLLLPTALALLLALPLLWRAGDDVALPDPGAVSEARSWRGVPAAPEPSRPSMAAESRDVIAPRNAGPGDEPDAEPIAWNRDASGASVPSEGDR